MARNRNLTPEEAALWAEVMKGTTPLKGEQKQRVISQKPPSNPRRRQHEDPPRAEPAPVRPKPDLRPPTLAARAVSEAADLTNLDRQSRKKVRRGKIEVDAKIDLHGLRQEEAHNALIARAMRARADGARVLLVVTGKGVAKEGPKDGSEPLWSRGGGVLKAQVPQWLTQEPLRSMIFSVQQAHQRHGGTGALYVFLKK